MHRNRLTLALLVPTVLSIGCSPQSPSAPEADAWLDSAPLVRAPVLSPSDLIQQDTASAWEQMPGEEGEVFGPVPADFEEDDTDLLVTRIIDPDSRGDFQEGFGGVYGTHRYTGNVGYIETTAQLTYRDQHLGNATGRRQNYTPFLGDFGQIKHIGVFPKIFSDRECGLSVYGRSQHAAWWHFYQGGAVQTWGRQEEFSQAEPYSQGKCTENVGEFEAENTKPGGMVCTYLITYDLETGDIVNAELLYCSSTGGEVI
ncbi:MAG: hypothetical protein R3253_13605 [Longimicrobiales bacterium]|nr:hypothetical protein [Longimicrobiales bacterium]